jgi:hypothetical protein
MRPTTPPASEAHCWGRHDRDADRPEIGKIPAADDVATDCIEARSDNPLV